MVPLPCSGISWLPSRCVPVHIAAAQDQDSLVVRVRVVLLSTFEALPRQTGNAVGSRVMEMSQLDHVLTVFWQCLGGHLVT